MVLFDMFLDDSKILENGTLIIDIIVTKETRNDLYTKRNNLHEF